METSSHHVVYAGLKLVYSSNALYLILLSGADTGMYHHTWLLGTSKPLKCLAGISKKKKREEREEEVKRGSNAVLGALQLVCLLCS